MRDESHLPLTPIDQPIQHFPGFSPAMEQPTHISIGEPAHNSLAPPTANLDSGALPGAVPDGNATRIGDPGGTHPAETQHPGISQGAGLYQIHSVQADGVGVNPNEHAVNISRTAPVTGPVDERQNDTSQLVQFNQQLVAPSPEFQVFYAQLNERYNLLLVENNELAALSEKLLVTDAEQRKIIDYLKSRNESLAAQNRKLAADLQSLDQRRHLQVTQLQAQIDSFRRQNHDLIAECKKLETSVSELRSHMYAKGMAHSPRHPDSYYVDKFRSLNGLIEQKLLDFSEDHSGYPLSDALRHKFLRYLEKLGPEGQKTHGLLTRKKSQYSLQVFYREEHLRELLLRHVTALYLFRRVFKPFAAGISPEISEVFSAILEEEKKRGSLAMDELLTLSTVFGLKATDLAESEAAKLQAKDPYSKDHEADIVYDISVVLGWLLPLSDRTKIETALRGVVKQAVALKNELAIERTLSRFFWYDTGSHVDAERVEARDTNREDLFCVFPGISGERLILGVPATVVLLKATAVALG